MAWEIKVTKSLLLDTIRDLEFSLLLFAAAVVFVQLGGGLLGDVLDEVVNLSATLKN